MAFAELLYSWPADRLRTVIQRRASTLRGVPRTADKRELVTFLAGALSTPDSVGRALADTTRLEARVLIAAISYGGEVDLDLLVSLAGEDCRERIVRAVDGLESAALALWDRRDDANRIFVPKSVRQQAPLPLPLRHRLAESLGRYEDSTVRLLTANLQVESSPRASRASRVADIVSELADKVRLDCHLSRLTDEARAIFNEALDEGGVIYLQRIASRLDARKRNQLMGWGWSQHWLVGKPRNGVEELLAHGLAVVDNGEGWGRWRLVIPMEIMATRLEHEPFQNIAPEEPEWELLPAEAATANSTDYLLRDVAYLMGFIGRTDAARTGAGNMHKTALKALGRGLSDSAPGYPELVYALARDAGLIAPDSRKALYQVTNKGEAWALDTLPSQLDTLYQAWRGTMSWAEPYVEPLRDDKTYRSFSDIDGCRESVIKLLTELGREHGSEYASVESLAGKTEFRWWHRFSFDDQASHDGESGLLPSNLDVVRRIAMFTLSLLRLTETAAGADGQMRFVRLSPLGRNRFLGEPLPVDYSGARATTFTVLPNLEIYAPSNLPATILYRLFRLGEPGAQGLIVLSRESLRRAFDRGESAAGALAFLRNHADKSIPQNVEYLIQEVGGRHGHIRVGQAGLYLQVDDPILLKELKAQNGLKIRFRQELADTVALVTGDSVDAVLKQLRSAGYFPVAAGTSKVKDEQRDDEEEYLLGPRAYQPPRTIQPDFDLRIDWAAIARSDGTPWQEPQPAKTPASVTGVREITALVNKAISGGLCLEIEYYTEGVGRANVRTIEPQYLSGSLVTAHCRLRNDQRVFNLRNIRWARETGELFDPEDEG